MMGLPLVLGAFAVSSLPQAQQPNSLAPGVVLPAGEAIPPQIPSVQDGVLLPHVKCIEYMALNNSASIPLFKAQMQALGLWSRVTLHLAEPDPDGKAAGCFRAHVKAWNDALARGCEDALLLEEDVVFDESSVVAGMANADAFVAAQQPYDLLLLGYSPAINYDDGVLTPELDPTRYMIGSVAPYENDAFQCVYRIHDWLCTQSYIISSSAMQRWKGMEYVPGVTPPIDFFLSTYYDTDHFFTLRPMIGFQRYHLPVAGQTGTEETGSAHEIRKLIPGVVYSIYEPALFETKANITSPAECIAPPAAYTYDGLNTSVHLFLALPSTPAPEVKDVEVWAGPPETWGKTPADLNLLLPRLRYYNGPKTVAAFGPDAIPNAPIRPVASASLASEASAPLPPTTGAVDTSSPDAMCASLVEQAPVPKHTCWGNRTAAGRPPMIINAGEGKTATSSISIALGMLGLMSVHQGMQYRCAPEVKHVASTDASTAAACPLVTLNQTVYPPLYKTLMNIPIHEYESFDYCSHFDAYDAYADTPFHVFAPHVYAAFGPGTKVILTVEAAEKWSPGRAEWDAKQNISDLAPMSWMFQNHVGVPSANAAVQQAHGKPQRTSVMGVYEKSPAALQYSYISELAMLSCVVRPEDLLVINVGAEAKNPRKLWTKLATFLNRSTDGLDLNVFPNDQPGGCPAPQVVACSHNYGAQVITNSDLQGAEEETRKMVQMCLKINRIQRALAINMTYHNVTIPPDGCRLQQYAEVATHGHNAVQAAAAAAAP